VVSGQPFPGYLADHIFTPLGMTDTRVVVVTTGEVVGADAGHVTAYGGAIGMPEMTQLNGGSGGVISTAHDMTRWLAMQQNGGVAPDGTRLLSEELIKEAQSPQPASPNGGLGWRHTQTADPARVGHDGSETRYSSRLDLVPSSGYGVVVLLNSYTPTLKHPFSISTGIIDITEGDEPELGAPVPTIIDAILGLITVGVLALAARGLLRVERWVERRKRWPGWRFALRLLPQLIMPAAAVFVFVVLPLLQNNTATPLDAFGLWPAAMILLLAGAVAGLTLTVVRIWRRVAWVG
jgi:CubicO group peptidase (beta-lactamase class C family)